MRDLITRRRISFAVVLLVVLAAAVVAHRFLPSQPSALLYSFIQSLHGPGFAAIAAIIFFLLGPRRLVWSRYLITAVIAGLIGLLSEVSQIPGPRDAQFKDLFVDAVGIIAVLACIAIFDPQVRSHLDRTVRLLVASVAGVALSITFVPTIWYTHALLQQSKAVPRLLSFEERWESAVFSQPDDQIPKLIRKPDHSDLFDKTIAHATEAGRWGIFLSLNPAPDWSGYSKISFIAAAATQPFDLAVGITDIRPDRTAAHNRYYGKLPITNEPKRFSISFNEISSTVTDRPFDFEHVDSVVFSAAKPGAGMELLIDDIRLE